MPDRTIRSMCGRINAKLSPAALQKLFGSLDIDPEAGAFLDDPRGHYNAAPTQRLPIVRLATPAPDASSRLTLTTATWGLVPAWAADKAEPPKVKPINARCETVATSGMFRGSFRSRRCIVPAAGYYEWEAVPGQKTKRPHYLHRADDQPMLLAGLREGDTFTIITTSATPGLEHIHDRTPVVLEPEDVDAWLNPSAEPAELQQLLRHPAAGVIAEHVVGTAIGNVKNNGPELIQPA
ncbi:MAG TPA: SOS response-associated peptidase [Phycisphaerales bacterium]|nr:SOS response-associated peptidase [Phycisphaerales bacterium]